MEFYERCAEVNVLGFEHSSDSAGSARGLLSTLPFTPGTVMPNGNIFFFFSSPSPPSPAAPLLSFHTPFPTKSNFYSKSSHFRELTCTTGIAKPVHTHLCGS